MTEQGPHPERSDHPLTARQLVGKALVDEYITLDQANQIYTQTMTEVLPLIAKHIEKKGDDLLKVLREWQVLDEVLEYLNKTE